MRSWLVACRKGRSLTQHDVSDAVGISRAYYAQIELGMRNPSIRIAKSIASFLQVNWVWFYDKPE